MAGSSKIDASSLYQMFEEINDKLGKRTEVSVETKQVDVTAVQELSQQLEQIQEEMKKPTQVQHRHRHTIDIGSSKVFLSLIAMAAIIIGLSYIIGEQRRSINQMKDNDLKYRYIWMKGKINEKELHRLEHQFRYNDSIKIIRMQVEQYERKR